MDFKLIENLTDSQVDELYNDLIEDENELISLTRPWRCYVLLRRFDSQDNVTGIFQPEPEVYWGVQTYYHKTCHQDLTTQVNLCSNKTYTLYMGVCDVWIHNDRHCFYNTPNHGMGGLYYFSVDCYSLDSCLEYFNNYVLWESGSCHFNMETYEKGYIVYDSENNGLLYHFDHYECSQTNFEPLTIDLIPNVTAEFLAYGISSSSKYIVYLQNTYYLNEGVEKVIHYSDTVIDWYGISSIHLYCKR